VSAPTELRATALAALMAVSRCDVLLLRRVRERLASIYVLRPPGWKDHNPRSLVAALTAETDVDVHELACRVYIDAWGKLCNFAEWYPAELVGLLDEALSVLPKEPPA
jgi:hypothetical protein